MAKQTSYVGIDLGGSSLKIVEMREVNGRPQLATYGFADQIPNIIKEDGSAAVQEVALHLKELLKESKVGTDRAVAALPSFSVFSSIINLPAMSKKDLESAVRWEAKKFVPIPLEEMILDWEVLKEAVVTGAGAVVERAPGSAEEQEDTKKKEKDDRQLKGNVRVLLTAAPKNLVNRYVAVFKEVGLQLVGLETESFALERALVGNDKNPVMVIDVGGSSTSIVIYSEGVPILNRSIDVGGVMVTKAVVESSGLPAEQAEQLKRDIGASGIDSPLDQLPQPIRYLVNSIVNEVRYIVNIYQSQNKRPVSKIILTGGSSFLVDIPSYLQKIFNIKAYIGDPWARVVHPVEIDDLLKQLGPRLAVAIGLSMREIV
ncbi:MAG: pilus assembly protein PilM [Patescibacteria group bacterium]